jgi:hypothetical protein
MRLQEMHHGAIRKAVRGTDGYWPHGHTLRAMLPGMEANA